MARELSLIDTAAMILAQNKQPYELFDLFDAVTKEADIDEAEKTDLITKFYTDLTTSAKFVYVGDNKWNLKANEKIELWEKDGSFYKEYTVVELPDEYKEDPFASTKKPAKPAPVKQAKPEPEVVEEVVEPEVAVEEEVKPIPVVEPVIEPVEEIVAATDADEAEEEYEEEVFEEYDDFDEEKYNEYMDNYEDQYDD